MKTSPCRSFLQPLSIVSLSLAAFSGLATMPAKAVHIQFGSNFYEFVSVPGISWDDGRTAAAASIFNGVNGHLATITSQAENDFLSSSFPIFSTFTVNVGSWLGARVTPAVTGVWQVGPEVGEAFSQGQSPLPGHYANWPSAGIEPNNAGLLDSVYMLVGTTYSDSNGHVDHGQWADSGNGISWAGDPVQGYFVEYEGSAPEEHR